jgi:hypothetical protein
MQLDADRIMDALDAALDDSTEAAIVITSSGSTIIVRTFGPGEAVADALLAAAYELSTSLGPCDTRPH